MAAAIAAGALALSQHVPDAAIIAIGYTAIQFAFVIFSTRKKIRALELVTVSGLDADRQRAALEVYVGDRSTDDPTVTQVAVRLMLAVYADSLPISDQPPSRHFF